jgi:predicted MPP superfamily phosphohydrolase
MTRSFFLRYWWLTALLVMAALIGGPLLWGWTEARRDPIVRTLDLAMPDWPKGTPPIRMVLATDLHVSNLGASKQRTARVIDQINALRPDIVMLGGDFVGGGVQDHPERIPSALAPLKALRPRIDSLAVLGNHDSWSDPNVIRRALNAAGIRVLTNSATRIGPLIVGGIGDQFSHNARLLPTEEAMARRLADGAGPMVIMGHGPDLFPLERMLPLRIPLTLAGHTHCGQIALPFYGAIVSATHFGLRYACGVVREDGRVLVTSGGIGTSQVPIRLFAPPDIWLITLHG